MKARVGDRLVIRGHAVGEAPRDGEITEVRGPKGGPPYLVRWEDGHVGLVFPGSDAAVEHFEKHRVVAAPWGSIPSELRSDEGARRGGKVRRARTSR